MDAATHVDVTAAARKAAHTRLVLVESDMPWLDPIVMSSAEAGPAEDAAATSGATSEPADSSAATASAEAGTESAAALPAADAAAPAAADDQQNTAGGGQGAAGQRDGKARVPLSDPSTLAQLGNIKPGCCVAILRCSRPTQLPRSVAEPCLDQPRAPFCLPLVVPWLPFVGGGRACRRARVCHSCVSTGLGLQE